MDSNKTLKSLIFTSVLLSLSANAFNFGSYFTNSFYCDPLVGSGLYLGLGAQRVAGNVDYNSTSSFVLGLLGTKYANANIAATGHSGVAFIGFGLPLVHHFYLGAEAQTAGGSRQQGDLGINSFFHEGIQIIGFDARVKFINNYGIFIRPGYYATDNYLLFLRAGYIRGNFRTAAVPAELGAVVPTLNEVEQKDGVGGSLIGAGIEMHIIKGLGARAEYDVLNYYSFNTRTNISFQIPAAEVVQGTTFNKFSPQANVVMLALTYSFGYGNSDAQPSNNQAGLA